jgi:sn-glycerol 3-phosphate transport system substrate-binding protein
MPFNSSTPIFYYNKDAFKKAGLDPEKPPKTWTRWRLARRRSRGRGAKCGFSTGWPSWTMVENMHAYARPALRDSSTTASTASRRRAA